MSVLVGLMAEEFWRLAGGIDRYPADIERAAVLSLPIAIVSAGHVSVEVIRAWLAERELHVAVPRCPGDMAGCVVAYRGHAFIFIGGADPDDEVRITVAHEVAHVLRHYLKPRAEAVRALGVQVLEVLDGCRAPTFREQVHSVLASTPLGAHVHLLPRGSDPSAVNEVEREADELALELVAPHSAVLALLQSGGLPDRRRERGEALAEYFGIPARWFARVVAKSTPGRDDPLDYLFASLRRS